MTFIPQIPNDWLKKQNQQLIESERQGNKFIGVDIQRDENPDLGVPVIYGFQRLNGPVIYLTTKYGDSNILYMVVSLAEGQCGVINRLFIDDLAVGFDNEGTTNPILPHNTITYPRVNDRLRPSANVYDILAAFEYMDGRPGQGVSNLLKEIYAPATAPSPPRFTNLAYLVCKFVYRSSVYRDLPKVTVDLYGRPAQQFGSAYLNPANQLYDYLTNSRYGAGIAAANINTTSFQAVYDYLETNRVKQASTDTGWSVLPSHITLDPNNTVLDNVNLFLTNFGLILSYINGKYNLSIEGKATSAGTVTDSMITSDITITKPSSEDKFNSYAVDYYDVANNFVRKTAVFPAIGVFNLNTFENQDNGRRRIGRVEARGIGYYWTALSHAKKLFYKSRNQDVYTFTCVKEAYQYSVGDVITLNTTIPLISNQTVRIISITVNEDFSVNITAAKHSNDWYPPFTGDTPNFGGALNVPVLPSTHPTPTALVSADETTTPIQPAPGDPGGTVIIPQNPLLPATPTITMYDIAQPGVQLSTVAGVGQTLQSWPKLRRTSNTVDDNWYLGRIEKQQIPLNSNWSAKVGNYAYSVPNNGSPLRFSVGTRRPALDNEYCFGTEARVARLATSKTGLTATTYPYVYQVAPVITYRYQGETTNDLAEIADDDRFAGQYKKQPFLVFLYTMNLAIGSQSQTLQFGFQREVSGNNYEYYLGDLEKGSTLQKLAAGKVSNVHWTDIIDIMPRMEYRANINNLNGGHYGGILDNDARTCVQWICNNPSIATTSRPGMDCGWPLPGNLTPTTTRSSAAKITFKIFAIPDLSAPRPEYLGFVEGTSWVAAANQPGGFLSANSIRNWSAAGRGSLPQLD